MSQKCIEYLHNSLLYSFNLCENLYSGYSDNDLKEELEKYRTFVLDNISEIRNELKTTNEKLNVCIESFDDLPSEDMYRHLVLYMDQIIIPDPVFNQTETQSDFSKEMGKFLGFSKSETFDRKKLVETINYIRDIRMLIDSGFVIMMPISIIHEGPKEIPITYSPSAFADKIPQDILNYYRSIVHVNNLTSENGHMIVKSNEPLKLGTRIYIRFDDDIHKTGSIYQYMTAKMFDFDDKASKARIEWRPADSITKQEFETWVNQSINQSANHHFEDKYKELIFAKHCGCMYLSRSSLTAKIISMYIDKPSIDSQLATMAMHIDLPVTSLISLEDLLNIRKNYGEAFYNFRTELNSKLLSIDALSDTKQIRNKLDRISYELTNTQVSEVDKEYRKIMRTLKLDAFAMTGSLIASIATGGLTAVGAAAAFVKGASDIGKYFTDVNEHNGFFLWKVKRQADKTS